MDKIAQSVFPGLPEMFEGYTSLEQVMGGAAKALADIQDMTRNHFNRAVGFILYNSNTHGAEARIYVLNTLDALMQPRAKNETSLMLTAALRLVVYKQCAHLSDLYRDVPGVEMATEQPRVVVAYHRRRLEWLLLGTILELALDVLTVDAPIEDWLRIGIRLKFLATQLLEDAEALPASAKSDAEPLLVRDRKTLTDLEARLKAHGTSLSRRESDEMRRKRPFERFVHYLLADARINLDIWHEHAIHAERLLTRDSKYVPRKEDEPTEVGDDDEDEEADDIEFVAKKK